MFYWKQLVLFIYYLVIALNAELSIAQSIDSKNKKFFKKQLLTYEKWLDHAGLSPYVEPEGYRVEADQFVVEIKNTDEYRNPELMAQVWLTVREQFEEAYGLQPEKVMVLKLANLLEASPAQVRVEISGVTKEIFYVSAQYLNDEFVIEEKIDGLRGNGDKLLINIKDLGLFAVTDKTDLVGQLQDVKRRLVGELKDIFMKADSKFGNDPKVELIHDGTHEFTLMVSNVTNQIISRYFELISLNVELAKQNDQIVISYSVFGKYSSGIFVAPRQTSSDYQDMFPEFSAEISLYVDKLGQTINSILKDS